LEINKLKQVKTEIEIIRRTLKSLSHMISENRLNKVLKALNNLEKLITE